MGLLDSINNFVGNLFRDANVTDNEASTGTPAPAIAQPAAPRVQPPVQPNPQDYDAVLAQMQRQQPTEQDRYHELYTMLNSPASRGLSQTDYFPSNEPIHQGNVGVGNINLPVYAYTGSRFPMAVYEHERLKQREQALYQRYRERPDVIEIKPTDFSLPDMKLALGQKLAEEANTIAHTFVQKYGTDTTKWKADPMYRNWVIKNKNLQAIDVKLGQAIKQFQADEKEGRYVMPQVKYMVNHLNEKLAQAAEDGEVDTDEINAIAKQIRSYDNFQSHLNNALEKVKPEEIDLTDIANEPVTDKERAEYMKINGLRKIDTGDPNFKAWVLNQKITRLSRPQAEDIYNRYLRLDPSNIEAIKIEGENEDNTRERIIGEIQRAFGRKIEDKVLQHSVGKGTSINIGGGGAPGTSASGVYANTVTAIPEITKAIFSAMAQGKTATDATVDSELKAISMLADKSGSLKPHGQYVGFEIPGKWNTYNQELTPRSAREYNLPEAVITEIGGADVAPSDARLKDVAIVYATPDGKGGYKLIPKQDLKKSRFPENAEPVVLETSQLKFEVPVTNSIGEITNKTKPKYVTATRIFPASAESVRGYDEIANQLHKKESAGAGKYNVQIVD